MTRRSGNDAQADKREARLKAALRANLARRKAQGRARTADAPDETRHNEQHGPETPANGQAPENED